jgi:hypothetical protein
MKPALHVKWAKSAAWKHQWAEEVTILQEEMHQVMAYSKWCANWWELWSATHVDLTKGLEEGLQACALHQSSIHQGCTILFQKQWASLGAPDNLPPTTIPKLDFHKY